MASFINNAITDAGRLLLGEVQMGAVFTPTRIVLGSGRLPSGTTVRTIKNVVYPVVTLEINKKAKSNDGNFVVGGVYSNESITSDFYFRELALYAKAVKLDGTEVAEVLYSYGNAGEAADYMPAYTSGTPVERQIDIATYIGNDTKIDMTIESGMYITRDQAEEIVEDAVGDFFVKRTGDTMNGSLTIDGGTDWQAAVVKRTIGDVEYSASLGVGITGSGAIEVTTGDAPATRVGRIDIDAKGIQFDLANKYAMQNYLGELPSGKTILQFANECQVSSSISCIETALPSDAPMPSVEANILVMVGAGGRKTVLFMPYNNRVLATYTRDIFNNAWLNQWVPINGLVGSVALYVGPSGSDTTGDGSTTKPFNTIAKALASLPKNLNGNQVTINVAAGTYSEARVDVTSFVNGGLIITGSGIGTKPTISNGVYINQCSAVVTLKNLTLMSSSSGAQGVAILHSPQVVIDTCAVSSSVTQQNHGVLIDKLSTAYLVGVHITNCNYAILARAARAVLYSVTGGGNRIGFYATDGGDIRIRESSVTSTSVTYLTEHGGRVYMGAQVSAPNY